METNTLAPSQTSNDASSEIRGLRRVIWAMTVILSISLAANLLLAYKIKGLNNSLQAKAAPPKPLLPPGTKVAPIKASRLDGQQEIISYGESFQPVVLYVFTPQCQWCANNLANLKAILAQKQGSYRFVGLSLADKDLNDYVGKNKLDIPIYINPAKESQQEYKLGNTPQTIIVSPEGKVLQNWIGAYTGIVQNEVERYFGIKLPGLAPSG
jgi:hypothetical protein